MQVTGDTNIIQILEQAAINWPDNIALVNHHREINYQDLLTETNRIKCSLLKAGIQLGMGIAILGVNSQSYVAAMFAGMACGAVVLPISHQLKRNEFESFVNDTGVHFLFADLMAVPCFFKVEAFTECCYIDQPLGLLRISNANNPVVSCLKTPAYIRYTSGTTGKSKGVVLSHENIFKRVEIAQQAFDLTSKDVVLWILPMAYHFLASILVFIQSGAKIVLCENILANTLINTINQYQVSVLYASPMHYRLLAADTSDKQMRSLRSVISTSSALPEKIALDFKHRFGISVTQAYGIIEAGIPLIDRQDAETEINSVGYPVTGFEVAILDSEYKPVTKGSIGRLAIRGEGMFDAYLNPWQTIEQVLQNGWFFTGDLARRDEHGRYFVCGREKTMINVSGNKVFPEEVESVINRYPDISDSRVFGQQHSIMGEIVCAEVVVKQGKRLIVEDLLTFCRAELMTFKIPQRIQQIERVRYTKTGKICRA